MASGRRVRLGFVEGLKGPPAAGLRRRAAVFRDPGVSRGMASVSGMQQPVSAVRQDEPLERRSEMSGARASSPGQQAQPPQGEAISRRQRVEGSRQRIEMQARQRPQTRRGERRHTPGGERQDVVRRLANTVAFAQPARVARAVALPDLEARRDRGLHPGPRILDIVEVRSHGGPEPGGSGKSPRAGRAVQRRAARGRQAGVERPDPGEGEGTNSGPRRAPRRAGPR